MEEWERIRREARAIESSLEDKSQEFSRLAQNMHSDAMYDDENPLVESHEEQALANEIENLLSALAECNEKMNSYIVANGGRTANVALLQRYREILFDYSTEFKKTMSSIQRKRDSAELFSGARGGESKGDTSGDPGMDQLLRERSAITSSLKSVSDVIGQGVEAKNRLMGQRQTLLGSGNTMSSVTAAIPGVNRVIEAIQRKKTRDNIVLALVISGCICFTLWWLIG